MYQESLLHTHKNKTMLNDNIKPNHGASGTDAAPANYHPREDDVILKLTIDQKRQLLYEWFKDPKGTPIGKFCVQIKNVPHARPFLRKAAITLDLVTLRKTRKDQSDVVDDIARELIFAFTPSRCRTNRRYPPRVVDLETTKKLLVEFLDDNTMAPLGRFLRKHNALNQKECILPLVKRIRLCRLRKHRDAPGVRDAAVTKIDQVLLAYPNESKVRDQKRTFTLDELKTFLIEWYNDNDMISIVEFLKKKDALDARKSVRLLIRAIRLRKLRCDREDNPGSRQVALKEIDSLFEDKKQLKMLDQRVRRGRSGVHHRKKAEDAVDPKDMKALIKAWYNDDEMLPIGEFLRCRGALDVRYSMTNYVNTVRGLRHLRKKREKPGVHELAMRKINDISFSNEASRKTAERKRKPIFTPEQNEEVASKLPQDLSLQVLAEPDESVIQ